MGPLIRKLPIKGFKKPTIGGPFIGPKGWKRPPKGV